METLERVITEELQKIPSKKHLKAIDLLAIIKEAEDISYESLVDDDLGSLVKFLIAVGKNYGKAQWDAGAEATRNAIVEDVNFPPQYVA